MKLVYRTRRKHVFIFQFDDFDRVMKQMAKMCADKDTPFYTFDLVKCCFRLCEMRAARRRRFQLGGTP